MKNSIWCLLLVLSASLLASSTVQAEECRNQNKYYAGYFSCTGNSKVHYSITTMSLVEEDKSCPAVSPINTPRFATVSIIDSVTQQVKIQIKLAEGEYQTSDMGGMKVQFKVPSLKLKLNCEILPGGGFSIGN